MAYTIKKLATISGVSTRTLRFYDEIGLLKPAFYGQNQYRYYEEKQLLILQQILFYRELGMPLNDIQRIIHDKDFNTISALKSHKDKLNQNLIQTQALIDTIEKTLKHLTGEETMKDEEMYYGFDSKTQKKHEESLVNQGIVTQEFLDECNAKTKTWSDKQKHDFINDIERIMNNLTHAMENKLAVSSDKVQQLIDEHYSWLCKSWFPDKQNYLGLMDLYQTAGFRTFYDKRHPDLLNYLIKAMQHYADNKL